MERLGKRRAMEEHRLCKGHTGHTLLHISRDTAHLRAGATGSPSIHGDALQENCSVHDTTLTKRKGRGNSTRTHGNFLSSLADTKMEIRKNREDMNGPT